MAHSANSQWPELPYAAWRETRDTLHLWTQIVGKIRLMQTPWLNHSWHVTLYVTSRGLTTSPIVHGPRIFEVEFDGATGRRDPAAPGAQAEALRRLTIRSRRIGSANSYSICTT